MLDSGPIVTGTTHYRDGTGWETEAGYSRAVRRGNRISVSGTTADGATEAGDATEAQTTEALIKAVAAVEALGGTIEDITRTRIYLTPDADWEQASAAHRRLLGSVAPANTMLYVHALIGQEFLVEVEVEAEVQP